MSIICCIYVTERIVMAVDSSLTRTKTLLSKDAAGRPVTTQTTYTLSDNCQKVVLLQKTNVGISFCGTAMIDGMTVADYVRRFEIERVHTGDTTYTVANKLCAHCRNAGKDTYFYVCGYDHDIPFVFKVCDGNVARLNVAPQTGDQRSAPVITYSAAWAGQRIALSKMVNADPPMVLDMNTMPLKDAIDFAEFLIDTTIKYERFADCIQTCGGDIDILVITKDAAFWKQHKIYNPARLR